MTTKQTKTVKKVVPVKKTSNSREVSKKITAKLDEIAAVAPVEKKTLVPQWVILTAVLITLGVIVWLLF